MEIDLNHGVVVVQSTNSSSSRSSNAASSSSSSSSSSPPPPPPPPCSVSSSSSPSSICKELWHACAGPLTFLPKKWSLVVYFPQGHLEQQTLSSPVEEIDTSFRLPSQIFCRVLDVALLANKENDEVYTKLTLLPLPEMMVDDDDDDEGNDDGRDDLPSKSTSHMFCKTLTASDTSTHGGFSVPRRAAEDCFPPLDYKEQRPCQELVAKDLHGVEWKFRHIYRGQPRRHLLTTGWSSFVGQKNIVSGDAVLFLRGEGRELWLGIRRAARPRNGLPDSVASSRAAVLAPVANAVSSNGPFSIFYSPRAKNRAEFIVSYKQYAKCAAAAGQVPVGTRFKMRLDFDDTPERRFSGVVTGISDVDPYRWPNSKWRCLAVRWDNDASIGRHDRVSPWEIDLSAHCPQFAVESSPRIKKLRFGGSLVGGGGERSDFEESSPSMRSSENAGGSESQQRPPLLFRSDRIDRRPSFETQPPANA
ncbi:hypothetical protein M569_15887, partial [Genlisea aurea]